MQALISALYPFVSKRIWSAKNIEYCFFQQARYLCKQYILLYNGTKITILVKQCVYLKSDQTDSSNDFTNF